MPTEPRITRNVASVLLAMHADPTASWYGLKLAEIADVGSATVYAALTRLERADWVTASWENADPRDKKRPRRRLYTLTGEGARVAQRVAAEHAARAREKQPRAIGGFRPFPAGGRS